MYQFYIHLNKIQTEKTFSRELFLKVNSTCYIAYIVQFDIKNLLTCFQKNWIAPLGAFVQCKTLSFL